MPEPSRHRPLWNAIGCALILFVIYQSLTPAPMAIPGDEGSRLGHLAAYGTLMGWFANLHEGRRTRIACALAFVAMGVVLELILVIGAIIGIIFFCNNSISKLAFTISTSPTKP